MAEERIPSGVNDENREPEKKELAKDRKSLTGMSEKVKATLAPLLGGITHHPEVEEDVGRTESGVSTYETVPTGSTPMSRSSAVAEATTDNPNPNLHAPFQDVGIVHSSDVGRESGRSRSGHKPNEDQFVLDGNSDPVHHFRSTTPTSEAVRSRFTEIDRERGRVSLSRLSSIAIEINSKFSHWLVCLTAFGSTDTGLGRGQLPSSKTKQASNSGGVE